MLLHELREAISDADIQGRYARPLARMQANILLSHGRDRTTSALITFTGSPEACRQAMALVRPTSALQQWQESQAHPLGATVVTTVALSAAGYSALRVPLPPHAFPPGFHAGFQRPAILTKLGIDAKDIEPPYRQTPHALVTFASDLPQTLEEQKCRLRETLDGIASIHWQDGIVLREPSHGEPVDAFGFKDGLSQPVFFKQKLPAVSTHWSPEAAPRMVIVTEPLAADEDEYGSYLTFLKIDQDVHAFAAAVDDVAAASGFDQEHAAALIIGRRRNGDPLVGGASAPEADPNDFNYSSDLTGARCPLTAHIRKANPRTPESAPRRIARRSIPFVAGPQQGLLFQSYQAHLAEQFEFILLTWFASNDSPETGAAHDPVLQPPKGKTPLWPMRPDGASKASRALRPFVTIRGGAYFFSPSIPFLWRLGQI